MFSILEHNNNDSVNVKNVKAIYRAMKLADIQTLERLLVSEPFWDVCPGFPKGAVYKGLPDVLGIFYKNLRALFNSFGASPETFIDGGDTVVVLGYYHVQKNDNDPITYVRFCHSWSIENALIKGVWQVADSAQLPTE
jgi:hypothetical protein